MSYNIKDIYDLYGFPYKTISLSGNAGEFLIGPTYHPLLSATMDNVEITTLLPTEGISVPFTLEGSTTILFDSTWHGWLVKIQQTGTAINRGMLDSYMGHRMELAHREDNMILDGGGINISNRGNIVTNPGLCRIDGKIMNFAGLQLNMQDQISPLPNGRGFCLSVFIPTKQLDIRHSLIVPVMIKTDLVSTQIGDYSTLYSVIRSEYGVDFSSIEYIELLRMQMISQSPSTPYINSQIDQRMRQPPIDCYPS